MFVKNRAFGLFLLALLVLLSLFACTKPPASNFAEKAQSTFSSQKVVEANPDTSESSPSSVLVIASSTIPTIYLECAMQDYMLAHPDVQIVYREQIQQLDLQKQLLAGVDGIDIICLYTANAELFAYYDAGVFVPLQDYTQVRDILEDSRLIPGVLDAFVVNGDLVALPLEIAVKAIRYREDHLEQANMFLPDADWDWFDFFDMMENANADADGDSIQDGLPVVPYQPYRDFVIPIFFDDYLVNHYDSVHGSIDFDTDLFRDLMVEWKAYCHYPWLGLDCESKWNYWIDTEYNPERHSWGAMQIVDISINQGIMWDYALASYPYKTIAKPQIPGQDYYAIAGSGETLSVYSRSNNKDLAVDFLAFLCSYEEKHKYSLWHDEAIIYQIQDMDDYANDSLDGDMMAQDECALFLEQNMAEYMRIVGKSRIPRITERERFSLSNEIIVPYVKGDISLDEMIQQLT